MKKRLIAAGSVALLLVFLTPVVWSATTAAPAKKKEVKKDVFIAAKDGTMYHKYNCPMLLSIKPEDRVTYKTQEYAESAGYYPCGMCSPEKK